MESIARTKPHMAVLRRDILPVSPFAMLSRAFADEIAGRFGGRPGMYPMYSLEYLSAQEETPGEESGGKSDVHLEVQLKLILQQLRSDGKDPAARRILEKAEALRLQQEKVAVRRKPQTALRSAPRREQMKSAGVPPAGMSVPGVGSAFPGAGAVQRSAARRAGSDHRGAALWGGLTSAAGVEGAPGRELRRRGPSTEEGSPERGRISRAGEQAGRISDPPVFSAGAAGNRTSVRQGGLLRDGQPVSGMQPREGLVAGLPGLMGQMPAALEFFKPGEAGADAEPPLSRQNTAAVGRRIEQAAVQAAGAIARAMAEDAAGAPAGGRQHGTEIQQVERSAPHRRTALSAENREEPSAESGRYRQDNERTEQNAPHRRAAAAESLAAAAPSAAESGESPYGQLSPKEQRADGAAAPVISGGDRMGSAVREIRGTEAGPIGSLKEMELITAGDADHATALRQHRSPEIWGQGGGAYLPMTLEHAETAESPETTAGETAGGAAGAIDAAARRMGRALAGELEKAARQTAGGARRSAGERENADRRAAAGGSPAARAAQSSPEWTEASAAPRTVAAPAPRERAAQALPESGAYPPGGVTAAANRDRPVSAETEEIIRRREGIGVHREMSVLSGGEMTAVQSAPDPLPRTAAYLPLSLEHSETGRTPEQTASGDEAARKLAQAMGAAARDVERALARSEREQNARPGIAARSAGLSGAGAAGGGVAQRGAAEQGQISVPSGLRQGIREREERQLPGQRRSALAGAEGPGVLSGRDMVPRAAAAGAAGAAPGILTPGSAAPGKLAVQPPLTLEHLQESVEHAGGTAMPSAAAGRAPDAQLLRALGRDISVLAALTGRSGEKAAETHSLQAEALAGRQPHGERPGSAPRRSAAPGARQREMPLLQPGSTASGGPGGAGEPLPVELAHMTPAEVQSDGGALRQNAGETLLREIRRGIAEERTSHAGSAPGRAASPGRGAGDSAFSGYRGMTPGRGTATGQPRSWGATVRIGGAMEAMGAYPALSMDYGGPLVAMARELRQTARRELGRSGAAREMGMHTAAARAMEEKGTPETMQTLDLVTKPQIQEQVVWQNPYMRSSAPADITHHRKSAGPKAQQPAQNTVRMSDAEIRRTADKVFKLVQEKIVAERRRIGRI